MLSLQKPASSFAPLSFCAQQASTWVSAIYVDKLLPFAQVIAATKRAPLADRKQKKRDEAEMEEHEPALEPQPKRAKTSKTSIMGDKQKALKTIALGGFTASLTEQVIEAAASAGQACSI